MSILLTAGLPIVEKSRRLNGLGMLALHVALNVQKRAVAAWADATMRPALGGFRLSLSLLAGRDSASQLIIFGCQLLLEQIALSPHGFPIFPALAVAALMAVRAVPIPALLLRVGMQG
jgi:hypothetical protein